MKKLTPEIEKEIREKYKQLGFPLAGSCNLTFNKWFAVSQYGYPLTLPRFETEAEAESYTLNYYVFRMNLIRQ
jgi:hypothetical protein